MKPYVEKRVSFSFYEEDLKALRRLLLALRDGGLDVDRLDALRLVIYANSEAELFAHTALRLKREAEGTGPLDATVVERVTVAMPQALVDKLGRVADDLLRKDLEAERTFIARSALHAPQDVKALVRAHPKMEQEFPDRRSLRGKRRG